MPEDTRRRSVFVPPEHQELWADLEALASADGQSMSALVNDALTEFALLRAYRAGKAHQFAALAGASP